jgi:hypothetical protein
LRQIGIARPAAAATFRQQPRYLCHDRRSTAANFIVSQ